MDNDSKHPGIKSVGWALVQTSRLHRSRTGDKLSELGLFAGQEQVLQALGSSGPMTMGELATILRVRPPTSSKTVSRLSAIDALWDEVEAELLQGFDNKDRKRLRKLLRRAAKNLAGITGADQSGFEADDETDGLEASEPELTAAAAI